MTAEMLSIYTYQDPGSRSPSRHQRATVSEDMQGNLPPVTQGWSSEKLQSEIEASQMQDAAGTICTTSIEDDSVLTLESSKTPPSTVTQTTSSRSITLAGTRSLSSFAQVTRFLTCHHGEIEVPARYQTTLSVSRPHPREARNTSVAWASTRPAARHG